MASPVPFIRIALMPRRNLANRRYHCPAGCRDLAGVRPGLAAVCVCLLVLLPGCGPNSQPASEPNSEPDSEPAVVDEATAMPSAEEIQFEDRVQSNRADDGTLGDLEFVDTQGNTVRVDRYRGKKNVLLVFTRGFSGSLCPYCTTQTSRLIANYDKFVQRDTEVLLVYPGQKAQLAEFQAASSQQAAGEGFPFPVLLDEDLVAVNRLQIAERLAFPSSFIIDKKGNVTLAYVGKQPQHRPSIKALLEQLDNLQE
jgi:peroxiredoxin